MTDIKEAYCRAYNTLDSVTKGRDHAAHHLIWDDVAALLTGYKTVTYKDIIGSVKSKLLGNNSSLEHIYYPGECDEEFLKLFSLDDPEHIGTFWEYFLWQKDYVHFFARAICYSVIIRTTID